MCNTLKSSVIRSSRVTFFTFSLICLYSPTNGDGINRDIQTAEHHKSKWVHGGRISQNLPAVVSYIYFYMLFDELCCWKKAFSRYYIIITINSSLEVPIIVYLFVYLEQLCLKNSSQLLIFEQWTMRHWIRIFTTRVWLLLIGYIC